MMQPVEKYNWDEFHRWVRILQDEEAKGHDLYLESLTNLSQQQAVALTLHILDELESGSQGASEPLKRSLKRVLVFG